MSISQKTQKRDNKKELGFLSPIAPLFWKLVGIFLIYESIFISRFISNAPGREKYFLIIFTVVFAIAGIGILLKGRKK